VLIVSISWFSTRRRRRHNAAPEGLQRLIHRSAWKRNSTNFVYTEFSEVGQEFIGNSSLLASVGALIDLRRG